MIQNTADLRALLSNEIALVQNGAGDPKRLRAMAHACATIIKSKSLDLEFGVRRLVNGEGFAPPVELTNRTA